LALATKEYILRIDTRIESVSSFKNKNLATKLLLCSTRRETAR